MQRFVRLIPVPVLACGFGAVSGSAVEASIATAIGGLVWGVIVLPLAAPLAERGRVRAGWANGPLHVAVPLGFVALGGGLLANLLSTNTDFAFRMLQQPLYGAAFAGIHLLFEWVLVPTVLITNWHHRTRRTLLLIAAVAFYLSRMASALYFSQTATEWARLPQDTPVTGALLADIQVWLNLNWLRALLQSALVAILLYVALVLPRSGTRDGDGATAVR